MGNMEEETVDSPFGESITVLEKVQRRTVICFFFYNGPVLVVI